MQEKQPIGPREFQWHFGWYSTKTHAVHFKTAGKAKYNQSVRSLCGAFVYPFSPPSGKWSEFQERAQARSQGAGSMCKHCMKRVSAITNEHKPEGA